MGTGSHGISILFCEMLSLSTQQYMILCQFIRYLQMQWTSLNTTAAVVALISPDG
jgi:hypothetical protein